jgi:hypothetical protein
MRIEYTCADGSRTLAKWPSLALLHWLGRVNPPRPIENPEQLMLIVVGPPVPSDTHPLFLTLVYAEIERRWNKTPPIEIERPIPKKKYGGKSYQLRCLKILRWLRTDGDITKLKISKNS